MTHSFEIIDAHAHIFPDKIAEKAVTSIGDFYDLPMALRGLPEELDAQCQALNISRALVFTTATTPRQVRGINDFIRAQCGIYPRFLGLGCLHPAMEDPLGELAYIAELGLRGVKLHPDFQEFTIDDPGMLPVYRRAAALGLPILMHMGDPRYDYASPSRLANLLSQAPELTVIAAHLGGYTRWEEAVDCLPRGSVWVDTSSSLGFMPPERAKVLIAHFGADRVLFGTDYPMWDARGELERFFALGLSEEDNRVILAGNFKRLFGI